MAFISLGSRSHLTSAVSYHGFTSLCADIIESNLLFACCCPEEWKRGPV